MAATKIAQIRKQIEKLVRQEERIRKSAIKDVVARIKKLMADHEIDLTDLRGAKRGRPGRKPGRKPGRPRKAAAKAKAKAKTAKPAKAKKPAAKSTRAKPKPKYRSPENRKVTWTGRGRAPAWVKTWVGSGKKLDELLIK